MTPDEEKKQVASKALAHLREARLFPSKLLEAFTQEHRTHQQMEGGVMLEIIHSIAKLYGGPERSRYFDGRNEHLGKVCFEIDTFMSGHRHDMWHKLPLI